MKKIILLSGTFLLFIGCDGDGTSSGSASGASGGLGGGDTALCTELGDTLIDAMNEAYDGREGSNCAALCAASVEAAQALVDNSCNWPDFGDTGEDDLAGETATQDVVDEMEEGFCGDNGICN